jgi:hypothetical protein
MATAKTKGGSKIFWIIGGLVVIAGGIGAYFLLRKPKEDENNNDTDTDDKKPQSDSGSIGGGFSAPPKINAPKELNSKEKIESFQDYVLDVKKDKTILGNAGSDGIWGKNSQNAWDKYGSDYLSKNAGSKPSNTDIQTIVNSATGVKADASTLKNKNPDFVKKWAETTKNGRSAFVWSNQVYDTKRGEKVLDYNPLLYTMYSKVFGKVLRKSPSTKSEASSLVKDQDLGKPTSVAYADGYVWFYLPKSGRWIASINASRTKSSNFTGISDELEFANFDNNLDLNL